MKNMDQKKLWIELIDKLVARGYLQSLRVIQALKKVSRINFLPEDAKKYATIDSPLSIKQGQTISAPHD
jgi:protein-L-isoaspartate(D-aspartate) O-methyltransferase